MVSPEFTAVPQRIWTKEPFLGAFSPVLTPGQTRPTGPVEPDQRVARGIVPEHDTLSKDCRSAAALKPHWLLSPMLCHVSLGTEVSTALTTRESERS